MLKCAIICQPIMAYVAGTLKSQLWTTLPYPTSDFSGQTVIVTGSNTGLGKEAARHIARLGATRIVLAVRTISKGEAAAADIVASTGVPTSRILVWQLDMSDYRSIKGFSKRADALDRLDAVILNAGVMPFEWSETNGTETTMAINVVGTLLLTRRLYPTLQRSAKMTGQRSRLTIVGSGLMHTANYADFETSGRILDKLKRQGNVPAGNYYKNSKLLVYYAARHIARLHPVSKDSDVLLTVHTPGICHSDIVRAEIGWAKSVGMRVAMGVLARTTEVGGRTLVHAVSPDLPIEAHGRFLVDCQIVE